MLDLGSNVSILPKKSWEAMGYPSIIYFPIQLRMQNIYHIFPISCIENIEVDMVGIKTTIGFESIEIMGGTNSYPTLLGI